MMNSETPHLINGGISVDDRGSVVFANEFMLANYKRFYIVENHSQNFIRAWHGHKKEGKAFFVSNGSILVSIVKLDNFEKPSKDLETVRFVLDSRLPKVLVIPPGYANGFKNLSSNTQLFVFSTSTLVESLDDDYRFEFDYWNPWDIKPR